MGNVFKKNYKQPRPTRQALSMVDRYNNNEYLKRVERNQINMPKP